MLKLLTLAVIPLLACTTVHRPLQADGQPSMVHQCSGPDCGYYAVAGAVEAYAHLKKGEAEKLKHPTRITLKCYYSPAAGQAQGEASEKTREALLRLPCGTVDLQVFDQKTEALITHLKTRGEEIALPVAGLPKQVRVVARLNGCEQPQELKNLQAGEIGQLLFEWPCLEN